MPRRRRQLSVRWPARYSPRRAKQPVIHLRQAGSGEGTTLATPGRSLDTSPRCRRPNGRVAVQCHCPGRNQWPLTLQEQRVGNSPGTAGLDCDRSIRCGEMNGCTLRNSLECDLLGICVTAVGHLGPTSGGVLRIAVLLDAGDFALLSRLDQAHSAARQDVGRRVIGVYFQPFLNPFGTTRYEEAPGGQRLDEGVRWPLCAYPAAACQFAPPLHPSSLPAHHKERIDDHGEQYDRSREEEGDILSDACSGKEVDNDTDRSSQDRRVEDNNEPLRRSGGNDGDGEALSRLQENEVLRKPPRNQ